MDDYKERFELYCTANGIAEGAEHAPRRKAIFLTAVGATTYSLLKNLVRPRQPQELTLEDIIKELKDNYEPKKIVIAERFRFYKRPQKERESIAVYLAELRRLAKYCDFGDYLSTAIRDHLVCGLNAEGIQQKILAETDLTLEKGVQLAQAHESARQETYALRGDTSRHAPAAQPETAFVVKRQPHAGSGKTPATPGAEKECYRCGGKGHHPNKCWNKTRECHVCHKKGHIARACRSKNMKQMKSSTSPSWKNTKGTKAQTTYQVEEEEVFVVRVVKQTSRQGKHGSGWPRTRIDRGHGSICHCELRRDIQERHVPCQAAEDCGQARVILW